MMRLRTIVVGLILAVIAFAATLAVLSLWPSEVASRQPVLAEVPPLPPVNRTSVIVAPTVIALTAVADFMEAKAPPQMTGKRDFQIGKLISNGEIQWTVNRGRVSVAGRSEAISVSAPLTGTVRATGQMSEAGGIAGALGALLGQSGNRGGDKGGGRTIDQRADMRGSVMLTSRPVLAPAWRIEPNLSAQASVTDANLNLAGMRVNLIPQVQPLLERNVAEQIKELETRLRNDSSFEQAVRREWAKLCRSQSIGAAGAGLPNLWLELRPTRASAAQPRIDGEAVTLSIGLEAQARIVPQETRPDCPFPAVLEIMPQAEKARVNIAVPIDVPFAEINRLLQVQFAGKTFTDKNGSFEALVRSASVAASGDRLLISLRVKAVERTSWFGAGKEATIHIWGRPVLERETQVLRLADVALDVESEGLLSAAARTAAPYLERAVAERAVIDLKPFAATARRSIETAIAEFRTAGDGVRVDAAVTDLRIAGIAFDARTLRIIAEADGAAKVSVTSLPK